jgi:hypothetical protein
MDLDDFRPTEEAQPFTLVDPVTGVDLISDGKPCRIFVLGPETPKMKAIERAINAKRLKAAQRTGRITLNIDEIEAETIARLATSIAGWEGINQGGKPLGYSHGAAVALMTDLAWMRDQVDAFYRDSGNFLKATPDPTISKSH